MTQKNSATLERAAPVAGAQYNRSAGLCHGIGQYHTDNPKAQYARPYRRITLGMIEALLADPASVPKPQAPWVILSDHLSRVHSVQRTAGTFWGLWFDIDETAASFTASATLVQRAFPDTLAWLYTTRSATQDQQKLRGILPLAEPVTGHQYRLHAMAVNDRLQAAGITPDRATERPGQLCYLPNRGSFYSHAVLPGRPLHPSSMREEVAALMESQRVENAQRAALMEASLQRRLQRAAKGADSVVDAFNRQISLEHVLQSYGYRRKGHRWLSPNSESGTPGVIVTEDGHWLSSHGSDTGIGRSHEHGCWGDAFDLFVAYEHRGDYARAVASAAQQLDPISEEEKQLARDIARQLLATHAAQEAR